MLAVWLLSRVWAPPLAQYPVQGPLLSAQAGAGGWGAIRAAGAGFAYVRATEGRKDRSAGLVAALDGARAAGLRAGVVHRYSLCQLASDQAANVLTTVPRGAVSMPLAVEFTLEGQCPGPPARPVLLAELATFLAQVEGHLGTRAILLLRPEFEERYRLADAVDRPVWLSRAWFVPDYAVRPWLVWSANPARHVEGIGEPVEWAVVQP